MRQSRKVIRGQGCFYNMFHCAKSPMDDCCLLLIPDANICAKNAVVEARDSKGSSYLATPPFFLLLL